VAKVRSRSLVIDASIARAAGDTSMHPTSKCCREFLQSVLEICHRAVMSMPIKQEWDKHQSHFARQWRIQMVARKKLEILNLVSHHSLESRLQNVESNPSLSAIMEKDRILLEAALCSENRIASLDEQVRNHFRLCSIEIMEIRKICWVNPTLVEEEVLDWLKSGAPIDKRRTLGSS
jgi:hypothetical protein